MTRDFSSERSHRAFLLVKLLLFFYLLQQKKIEKSEKEEEQLPLSLSPSIRPLELESKPFPTHPHQVYPEKSACHVCVTYFFFTRHRETAPFTATVPGASFRWSIKLLNSLRYQYRVTCDGDLAGPLACTLKDDLFGLLEAVYVRVRVDWKRRAEKKTMSFVIWSSFDNLSLLPPTLSLLLEGRILEATWKNFGEKLDPLASWIFKSYKFCSIFLDRREGCVVAGVPAEAAEGRGVAGLSRELSSWNVSSSSSSSS